ncbi:MAG: ribosome maturation factor RimM [Thermomicrobiales bacterium]
MTSRDNQPEEPAKPAAPRPSAPRATRGAAVRPARPSAPGALAPRKRGVRQPVYTGAQRLIETAGPEPSTPVEQVRLVVGTIVGAFGVGGEAKLKLATDDPEHLATIKQIWLGDEPRPRKLLGVRMHKGMALLRIQGVSRPDQVDLLRGLPVRIAGSDARPLAPGEFFLYQLIGLDAFDESGALVGKVTDIMETGANDVLVITPAAGGADLLLPNHPDFVPIIDPALGRITVRPINYDE